MTVTRRIRRNGRRGIIKSYGCRCIRSMQRRDTAAGNCEKEP
jgi:hypothetical protein